MTAVTQVGGAQNATCKACSWLGVAPDGGHGPDGAQGAGGGCDGLAVEGADLHCRPPQASLDVGERSCHPMHS